jgi:hypothetical protein
MSSLNPITADTVSSIDYFKGMDSIKQKCLLKLDNRKKLANFINIAKLKGWDYFVSTCFPDYHNREIVKELLDFTECIGCSEKFPYDVMVQDAACENYCQKCWDYLSPIMAEEHRKFEEENEQ